ncbi:hypothetical protein ABZV67_45840 [Streptomyces sp. NPDC005065]|uniref:hypothetical protein n=1 Tax=Streptomyces sp. NPDC005065 TaxID=3154461 RepID=UPI0033BC7AD7
MLLRKVADRVGLTTALSAALPKGTGPGWRDRGMALVQLACAIMLGATNILEAEQLQYHWLPMFPRPVPPCPARRVFKERADRLVRILIPLTRSRGVSHTGAVLTPD